MTDEGRKSPYWLPPYHPSRLSLWLWRVVLRWFKPPQEFLYHLQYPREAPRWRKNRGWLTRAYYDRTWWWTYHPDRGTP